MYLSLYSLVIFLEILMTFGSSYVPILHPSTSASLGATLGLLATSLLSKISSKGTRPLGMVLLFNWIMSFPTSWVSYSGSGSTLSPSSNMFSWSNFILLNSLDISMNLLICLSSSKTCQWSTLSRIAGLCLTSILYYLFGCSGTWKTLAKTTKASAATFFFLGMTVNWCSLKPSSRSNTKSLYDLNLGCLAW